MKTAIASAVLGVVISIASADARAQEQRSVVVCGDLSLRASVPTLEVGGKSVVVRAERDDLAKSLNDAVALGPVRACVHADTLPVASKTELALEIFHLRVPPEDVAEVETETAVQICGTLEARGERLFLRYFTEATDIVELRNDEGDQRLQLDSWAHKNKSHACATGSRLPELKEGNLVYEVDWMRSLLQRTGFSVGSRYELGIPKPGASVKPGSVQNPLPPPPNDLRR